LFQYDDYDTGIGGLTDSMMDSVMQEQMLLMENQQPPHLHHQQQQRPSPFESFIRRWASIGNGYGRKITRAASY
jgi:hypothetical protein